MAEPVLFENREFLEPGGFSKFKIAPAGALAVDVATVLFLGESKGGIPHNATDKTDKEKIDGNTLTNINDADNKLREGDNLDATDLAFFPSNDPNISGARRVIVIRVNQATRSTIVLEASAADTIDVFSTDYGKHTNRTAIEVVTGTDPVTSLPGATITVFKDAASQISDFLFDALINVDYTGAEVAANLTIDTNAGTFKVNNGSTDFVDILLSDYPTIGELGAFLEANDFTVVVLNSSFKTTLMDDVAALDVLPATYLAGTFEKQLRFLNSVSEFTTAVQKAATARKPLDTLAKTFLTGGTETTPLTADWIAGIALAEKAEAFYQLELSGLTNIAALNKNSVLSSVDVKNRRERIGGSGTGDYVATTFAARQQEAKDLGNAFYIYGASPFDRVNRQGDLVTYEPKFLPALACGINSGSGVTTAPTFKALNVIGNPESPYTQDEKDAFILAGCQIIDNNQLTGVPQIVRSVTTFQGANLIASEMSMITTSLAMVKDFRTQLEALFVGQTSGGGPAGSSDLKALVEAKARRLLDGYVEIGYLTSDSVQAAFSNLTVTFQGDRVFIEKDATVSSPLNFIFDLFNLSALGL